MSLESEARAAGAQKFAWLMPDAQLTAETAFASGASWATSRVTVDQIAEVLDREGAQCGDPLCIREPGDPVDCDDCASVLARYATAIQRLYRGEEHHND